MRRSRFVVVAWAAGLMACARKPAPQGAEVIDIEAPASADVAFDDAPPPPLASAARGSPRPAACRRLASDADNKREAKLAYVRGKQLYDEGNYRPAAIEFEKADCFYPAAAPKYNAAMAFERAGDACAALALYRAFLDAKPTGRYMEWVKPSEARIAALRSSCGR
jgi:tetratricopeptide (TPR) repeat protein